MSKIKANLSVSPQDVFVSSTTQGTDLGAYATTGDGRVFRYALAGATTLVAGTLLQASAEDTSNLENLAVTAATAGTKTITISGAPTVSANALTGGFVCVTTAAGFGYSYQITSNTAGTASSSLVITLEDPIVVALTTSSKIDIIKNPYNGVVVNPTTATSAPVGVAVTAIPNGQYGWVQTHGPVPITTDGAVVVGAGVTPSGTTAGHIVTASTLVTAGVLPGSYGTALTGIAANETGMVMIEID